MSLRDDVLAALTKDGRGNKALRRKLGQKHSMSNLSAALKELEDEKLAVREKQERLPQVGRTVDRIHLPKVLWRLVE
jgi:DNA-binding HxlR family transcriptional regulator